MLDAVYRNLEEWEASTNKERRFCYRCVRGEDSYCWRLRYDAKIITVKYQNIQTPNNIVINSLKLKIRISVMQEGLKKMQINKYQTVKTLTRTLIQ